MAASGKDLVAPCGMNCGVCAAYLAHSHNLPAQKGRPRCPGCRPRNKNCALLKQRCPSLAAGQVEFCYECRKFPCHGIEVLDKRYSSRWNYSVIGNLEYIRIHGVDALLARDARRFQCLKCGDTRSVHNGKCYGCQSVESWSG